MMFSEKILKVSQINSLVKRNLEVNFTRVQVIGEISNLVKPSSGHIYFSLKDESAQVRAVMFREANLRLKFVPQNGAQVIVSAAVTLYEARGDYQLIISNMEPAGAGILHAKFLQLKEKLEKEGLFLAKFKKELPKLPETIGVITSRTGAVIRDILSVLKRRFPGVKIIVYPVLVQGVDAAPDIVKALQVANIRKECDTLILARGGGSIEDLWPFNEEIVARAIFSSAIPIISAVGHETDFTIADFVADVRAPTPSVAAEIAVPDKAEWLQTLKYFKGRLSNLIQYKLQHLSLSFAGLKNRLRHPAYYLAEKRQRLDDYERRLVLAAQHKLIYFKQHLAQVVTALNAMNPLATLTRGYAVVSKDSKIISSVSDVAVGDNVEARLKDGMLQCLVKSIKRTK
jgi:exodeoxyribonuclease VII large subunit